MTRHFLVQLIPSNRSQELKIHACAESTTHPARPSWPLCLMRPLLPKVRQDLGDTVTDRGWDGTDQGGRRPGSLWTPPQLPPGISSCLKPQRVFIRRPNRPEARLSALGSPTAVAWQEPKHSGLPAPGAGRPCSPEQWPLLVEGSVPPKDLLADPGQGSPVVHPRGLHVPRTCPSVLSRTTCRALGARATWRLETLGSHGGDMEGGMVLHDPDQQRRAAPPRGPADW